MITTRATLALIWIALAAATLQLLAGCSAARNTATQWTYTGGPYAQNVAAVLPDGKLPATLYAALNNGEICQTVDDGKTWTRLSAVAHTIHQIIQHPEIPEKLYAATGAGAFSSVDRGKTWTALHVGDPGTAVLVLCIDPWMPGVMFAGTMGKGIFRSADGGMSWSAPPNGADARLAMASVYDVSVDLAKPDVVYGAVSPLGIIRSTDAGTTWRVMTEEFTATGSGTTHILLRKNGGGTMLCGTDAGSIIKSTNGGESWIPSRNGQESDRINSLVSHPANPDLVFAGTENSIIMSTDFGTTWSTTGGDLPKIATRLAMSPAGPSAVLYAFGSGIGLRSSIDSGKTWHTADAKLGGSTVGVMASDPAGARLLAAVGTTCLAIDQTTPGGWVSAGAGINGGVVNYLTADDDEPATFYATTPGGVFMSSTNGASWQVATRTLRVSPDLVEPHPSIRTRLLAAAEQGLFVSTDRGKSWAQPRPRAVRWRVHALTFSPTNAGVILGATSNSGVILTTDGGFTWETAKYGLPADDIKAVTFDDKDPDVFYAYTAGSDCFRSLNKGLEWNRYAPPWKTSDTVRIAYDRLRPSSVVALVNNRELYYSSSGGGTWTPLINEDVNAEVLSLQWNTTTGIVYAGTVDKGVYKIWIGGNVRDLLGE